MVSAQLELHRYGTGRQARVITAMTMLKQHLFKYQGHVSAALVLGGFDLNGPHLFTVYPHGSTDALPFATMGSGSLNAMAVFEAGYKDGMTKEEAMLLVSNAIKVSQIVISLTLTLTFLLHWTVGCLQRSRVWFQRGPMHHQQRWDQVPEELRVPPGQDLL